MEKRKGLNWGIFVKLSVSFILIGLLPLLIISMVFFKTFGVNVRNIVLNDAEVMLQSASNYVDTMLEEWEDSTEQLYTRSVEPGIYLSDILSNSEIPKQQKNQYIRQFLSKWESVNGLKSVRFLDTEGNLTYFSQSVGKVVNQKHMEEWRVKETETRRVKQDMKVEEVHKDIYFSNRNDMVITVQRNLFNVTSLKTIDEVLGTVYLDIGEEAISQQLKKVEIGNRSGFYIIDTSGNQIYKEKGQKSLTENVREKMLDNTEKVQEEGDYYYLCNKNVNGEWISIVRIHKGDMQKNINKTRQYIIMLLGASSVVLMTLYFIFSRKISAPISSLKSGMEQIQKGNLDTRVQINSKDEVGALADGLNQMASELSKYINRVYGAEIKQKEAELKALKSQIKPHYLYNTLDIIRMTAVANEDLQTAKMIENLARQLRYLMGEEREMVPLVKELDNVRDYFSLLAIRSENHMDLTISISEELSKEPVLKLILQPIVENSIKHGLKPKNGDGNVWISAVKTENMLEISIMDNGIGMDEKLLNQMKEQLKLKEQKAEVDSRRGVGIRNVQERIQNRYGMEYGLEIESTQEVGTIIVIRIPVQEKDKKEGEF